MISESIGALGISDLTGARNLCGSTGQIDNDFEHRHQRIARSHQFSGHNRLVPPGQTHDGCKRSLRPADDRNMSVRPNQSLGIVAVNQLQRDLINDEMERLFQLDSSANTYRERWESTLYPFFVKNLENVQGDERDVIAVSTVYRPVGLQACL